MRRLARSKKFKKSFKKRNFTDDEILYFNDILELVDIGTHSELFRWNYPQTRHAHVEAYVTFRATIFCQGSDASFTEKSRFIKKDGKWFYEGGEILENMI